jgi:hypothetical protein
MFHEFFINIFLLRFLIGTPIDGTLSFWLWFKRGVVLVLWLYQFIDLGVLLTRDDIFPPRNSLFFLGVSAQSRVTEIPRRVF